MSSWRSMHVKVTFMVRSRRVPGCSTRQERLMKKCPWSAQSITYHNSTGRWLRIWAEATQTLILKSLSDSRPWPWIKLKTVIIVRNSKAWLSYQHQSISSLAQLLPLTLRGIQLPITCPQKVAYYKSRLKMASHQETKDSFSTTLTSSTRSTKAMESFASKILEMYSLTTSYSLIDRQLTIVRKKPSLRSSRPLKTKAPQAASTFLLIPQTSVWSTSKEARSSTSIESPQSRSQTKTLLP